MLAELNQAAHHQYVSAYRFAGIYIGLGDRDHAFSWLWKAVEERAFRMRFVRIEPQFNSLRSDPRFGRLLKQMNL